MSIIKPSNTRQNIRHLLINAVLLNDLLVHASYKMQRIKISQILMLQIKPVVKLKSSRENPLYGIH